MRKIIIWIFYCFICLYSINGHSQSSAQVDSVLSILEAAPKKGRVDTVLTKTINAILKRTQLTNEDVTKIVDVANLFKTGDDEDMSIRICYLVYARLVSINVNKSIDFGKQMVEKIENGKSPEKSFFRNDFLVSMRTPYRSSTRLAEGIQYYNNQLIKCKEANDSSGIAACCYVLGGFYRTIGLIDRAIYQYKKSVAYLDSSRYARKTYFGRLKYEGRLQWINNMSVLGEFYILKSDSANSIKYTRFILQLREKEKNIEGTGFIASNAFLMQLLAKAYMQVNRLDSTLYFLKNAYDETKIINKKLLAPIFQTWSLLAIKEKDFNKADSLLGKAWEIIREQNISADSPDGIIDPDYFFALVRIEQKKYAEALGFLISDIARIRNFRIELIRDYKLLAEVYNKMGDKEKSIEHYQKYINLQDSLLSDQSKFRTLSFEAEQQNNEKELAITQLRSDNKISSLTRNFSFGIIGLVLLLAGVIYYRYKSKEKANAVLEKTLKDLKSTQTQLIQSEKMASLGELTAGIAHEIQNPLNFVNNFSEVNAELIDELQQELKTGNTEEAIAISNDIKDNEQKINHHGKRADAIVKGMLQHSRSSNGQKEATDINVLCDEYLRLSYHGLRAKDKSFNATIKTDFNNSIGSVNIIPQDIGRVVLNLLTNAFYAVDEKSKSLSGNYEPTVSIGTKKMDDKILVTVKDNGNGIPQKLIDKIFQPFFTTKPTGQGTGLGLSLSYDIIKAHGGELTVETKEMEGTVFSINLPI